MKSYTLLLISLLITQILTQLCGTGPCTDSTCCSCRENPNQDNGNGFLEFNSDCLANGGGLNCVGNTGCRLCYKPTLGATNVGSRPVCARFAALSATCTTDDCCMSFQNPNPTNGVGYQEFNNDCLVNGGGLNCIADSGCQLCYQPILGSTNVGNRPICKRFLNMNPGPFTFPPTCINEACCEDAQNPNQNDGNGFLEFNSDCKTNGGGLNCVAGGGCQLCYKPILGGANIGNRPICQRFTNLLPICNTAQCCYDLQFPNFSDGNGFLELNADCLTNGGGLNCVGATGCSMCYQPVLGGTNIGTRPICSRFSLATLKSK